MDRLDFIARAALGIGIGAAIAALLAFSSTAFAADVGLANADELGAQLAVAALAIWFICRVASIRRP
jgi:hypothetical protein